jgi:hypothetical protein
LIKHVEAFKLGLKPITKYNRTSLVMWYFSRVKTNDVSAFLCYLFDDLYGEGI